MQTTTHPIEIRNLRFNLEHARQGELPRFELKAKRLVDKRRK